MPFLTWKRAKSLLWDIVGLAALASLNWSYFFPLSAHTDSRFQLVGESLALLALLGMIVLMRIAGFGEDFQSTTSILRGRVLFGAFFVVLLFTMFWRDFFPNDNFSFRAGAMDFFYAPAGGLGVIAISFILTPTPAKPGNEGERSVV